MDPYKVLGVDSSASDEEVKRAYKVLVKKYHPDRYVNNPLGDLASEKLKEVNAAYDMIQNSRKNGEGYSGAQSRYTSYSSDPRFNEVRMRIQRGDLTGAEMLLNNMQERTAEWYYLMGVILNRKGYYDGAKQHFTQAYNMDPNNSEYAQAYNMINNAGGYRDFYGGGGNTNVGGCSICDICAGVMCANLCCDCGGC